MKLFINGNEAASEFDQGSFGLIYNSEEPLRMGAYKNTNGDISIFFSGQIDEVRVWNIELTKTLIQQRKDVPLSGNEPGLALYLNMEQNGQGSS